jgi:type VI protein secretion system component Hcp
MTPCTEKAIADFIEKIGADKELPEDIIKIVEHGGDSVDILVTQQFEGTVTGFSVFLHDSAGSSECDAKKDMAQGSTFEYTAHCFEGYTDVSIFVFFGDAEDYSAVVCDACEPPDESSTDMVAFYFEISCSPICEATLCIEKATPDFIEKVGADKQLPEDVIKIVEHSADSVELLVTQQFEGTATGFSVYYHDSAGSTDCEAKKDMAQGSTLEYTAHCFEGYTDVSIFVFFGDAEDYSAGKCEACEPPDENSADMVAYYFEISCAPICELTPSPAACATICEITPCIEEAIPDFIEKIGADKELPEDIIQIVEHDGASVDILITQQFEGTVTGFSVLLHDSAGSTECEAKKEMAQGLTLEYTAHCFEGYTDVSIFVFFGHADDYSAGKCDACEPPDETSTDMVGYYFEISCAPICEKVPCIEKTIPDYVEKIGADRELPEDIIKIVKQGGDSVDILITQPFEGTATGFSVLLHDSAGSAECDAKKDIAQGLTLEYTAYCFESYTVVSIFVFFGDSDDYSAGKCEACEPPDENSPDMVAYYFEISCASNCQTESPTRSPILSQAPTPCINKATPNFIEKIGADKELPEDIIKIVKQGGESIDILVTQPFEGSVTGFSVLVHDSTGSSECEAKKEMAQGLTLEYTAHCFEDYTDVSIYVFFGDADGYSAGKCEACEPPDENSADMVAYFFEIACVPICETESPAKTPILSQAPTPCIDKATANFIEKIGADKELPEDIIKIVKQGGESIDILVTQPFEGSVTGFSVLVHDSTGSSECEAKKEMAQGLTLEYTAHCFEEYTDVSIYVFFGDSDGYSAGKCEACEPPDGNSEDMVAYYFEIACAPICETESPTESPSRSVHPSSVPTGTPPTSGPTIEPTFGPTGGPTSGPTRGPTSGPTSEPTLRPNLDPTLGPTGAPTESPSVSQAPTPCIEKATPNFIEKIGADKGLPEDIIQIVKQGGDSVDILVTQPFEGTATGFSVLFHASAGSVECEPTKDMAQGLTLEYTAQCFECEACEPPDDNSEDMVAYYFEISCAPICETESPTASPSMSMQPSLETTGTPSSDPTSGPTGAPSESPSLSQAPTPCIDKATPNFIEKIGADKGLPEDIIQIVKQGGDSVDILVTQPFEGTATGFSVLFHTSAGSAECEPTKDMAQGLTLEYTAQCFESYTDLSIFVFFGDSDGYNAGKCEACEPPDDNSEDMVAYYFEISCAPICETESPTESPSMSMQPSLETTGTPSSDPTSGPTGAPSESPSLSQAPTPCIDKATPNLIEKIGADKELSEDIIQIVKQGGDSVDILVTQSFEGNVTGFSVHFHDLAGSAECEPTKDMAQGHTVEYTAQCFESYTQLSIFVFFGDSDDYNAGKCEACEPPDENSADMVAYYFEISCAPICETESPTESPSTSMQPSLETTGTPSSDPTSGPSTAPSESPSLSQAPTPCIEKATPDFIEMIGADKELPEDIIQIVKQGGDSVDILVTQPFEGTVTGFSVHFHDLTGSAECEAKKDVAQDVTMEYTAQCVGSYTDLSIFVFFGDADDYSDGKCEACEPPDKNSTDMVAYYFEISCAPICETESPTESPSRSVHPSSVPTGTPSQAPTPCIEKAAPDFIEKIGADKELPEDIIQIVKQGGDSVDILVTQPFEGTVTGFSVHFHDLTGSAECKATKDMAQGHTLEYTAQCFESYTELSIFVFFGDADVYSDGKCEACQSPDENSEDMVAYFFEISCAPICETESPTDSPSLSVHPSSVPTGTASQAPTPCIEKAAPDFIEKIGADKELPEDIIQIVKQGGDSVDILVTQPFEGTVTGLSVHFHDLTGLAECKATKDMAQGLTLEYTAQCFESYTELSIFVFFGDADDYSAGKCEACEPPHENSADMVAYYFEISCAPICETESPTDSPTPCIEKASPDFIESIGADVELPEDAVQIVKQHQAGGAVDIVINQIWNRAGIDLMSIHYYDSDGSFDCVKNHNVDYGAKLPYTAHCLDGVADVIVYVVVADGPDSELCEFCQAPDESSTSMVAYSFEISCDPICVEEIAIAAPPSPAPQAALLDCYTGPDDQSEDSSCPYGDMPINIITMGESRVDFTVENTWGVDGTNFVVRYQPRFGDSLTCESSYVVGDGEALKNGVYEAKCNDEGVAEVEIFVTGGPNAGFPGHASEEYTCGDASAQADCAHKFVLPCKAERMCTPAPASSPGTPAPVTPTPAPVPSLPVEECAGYIISMNKGNDSEMNVPSGAITVESVVGNELTFAVKQLWKTSGSVNWASAIVDLDGTGNLRCQKKVQGFAANSVTEWTTMCSGDTATVQLNLNDGLFEDSDEKNPGICSGWPTDGEVSNVVTYDITFKCECIRRLDDLSLKEAFTADETMAGANEPSENDEDIPYCVSEDYPCEGEDSDMVYVCHYSARKGYQTFCIPENDSDILRFYPNDYCGPCEGGYGDTWSKGTGY